MKRNELAEVAQQIAQSVVENGRVETDNNGNFIYESYREEVEFEARERGFDDIQICMIADFVVG